MVRTVCPGLYVLRFKYLTALTRRTTVTVVGTGLPNHCLHRATGSISSTLPFPHSYTVVLDRYCLKTLTEDFLNFLNPISLVSLSSDCLSCVYATFTLRLFSFHDDDRATTLLCLHLSTYSAASRSWLRNFLTLKFLSDEFVKIAYSPPSSRYNALSIGIRARYSLVLCDFGLTVWSFSYVDCRYDQGLCWVSYLWRDGLPLMEE